MENLLFIWIKFFIVVFNWRLTSCVSEDAYFVLTDKIDSVGSKVRFLRKELRATKLELAATKDQLKQMKDLYGQRGQDMDSLTLSTESSKSNVRTGLNMEEKPCDLDCTHKETYTGMIMRKAWKSEKMFQRDLRNQMSQSLLDINAVLKETTSTIDETKENIGEFRKEAKSNFSIINEELNSLKTSFRDFSAAYHREMLKHVTKFAEMDQLTNDLQGRVGVIKNKLKQSVSNISTDLNRNVNNVMRTLEQLETCQSGNDVGAHQAPRSPFPYTVTIKFNPPFRKVPAFVYGTKLLDVGGHTRYNAIVERLTKESFTLSIRSWANTVLTGVKMSWMACPK